MTMQQRAPLYHIYWTYAELTEMQSKRMNMDKICGKVYLYINLYHGQIQTSSGPGQLSV